MKMSDHIACKKVIVIPLPSVQRNGDDQTGLMVRGRCKRKCCDN